MNEFIYKLNSVAANYVWYWLGADKRRDCFFY